MSNFRFKAHVGRTTIRASVIGDNREASLSARQAFQGIIDNFKDLINYVDEVTPEILREAMEPAFETSQTYCPKDTGKLVDSGYLQVVKRYNTPTVEIGYGKGGKPDYAAVVHENLEYRHKSPTRAKFLASALDEHDLQIQASVIAKLKGIVG